MIYPGKNKPVKKWAIACLFLSAFSAPLLLFAEEEAFKSELSERQDSSQLSEGENFLDMSIEELMDVDVVISAARQEQSIKLSSVPISVVTAADIHYSGLTNIPEILQFTPGVDFLQVSRNQYSVGVHGLHETLTDRLLTLIDGQVVDNPGFGGVEWSRLPILLEDIERIEVVRGPGGAAWGANAFTGIVNIITKKPEDTLGFFASSTWNHLGDGYNQLRWGAKKDKWNWRTSLGYEHFTSSEDAIRNDDFDSRDFSRNWRFNGTGTFQASKTTKYSFGLGYLNEETGGFEVITHIPPKNHKYQNVSTFFRLDHDMDKDRSVYLQWYGSFIDAKLSLMANYRSYNNNLEGQYDFKPFEDHKFSIGGKLRWHHYNTTGTDSPYDFVLLSEPYNEWEAGVFAIDQWQVNERLLIEGQWFGDYYSGTHCDWAGRMSGLYSLDEKKEHILRLSSAKAFRVPLNALRTTNNTLFPLPSPPLPPGLFGVNYLPAADNIHNEETWSLEMGYTGKVLKALTFRMDGYYQRLEHMIGSLQQADPLGLGRVFYYMDNVAGADTWGGECELIYRDPKYQLSTWYAYNDFQPDLGTHPLRGKQPMRAWRPARHKMGVTARVFLPHGFTLNSNYRYQVSTNGDQVNLPDAPSRHRLDLTLAKAFADEQGELMVGISDILNENNDPVRTPVQTIGHETPGRMYFARVQWKF